MSRIHLGWSPIGLKIWISVIKYWLRSYEENENEILKAAFLFSQNNHSLWKDGIQNLLTVTGTGDTWENPKLKLKKHGLVFHVKEIQKRLEDINYQNCQTELENSKKHCHYTKIHQTSRNSFIWKK